MVRSALSSKCRSVPHTGRGGEGESMSTRKQLTIVAVAALIVSVSFLYGVEPSVGMASNGSLKNVQANASHAGKVIKRIR